MPDIAASPDPSEDPGRTASPESGLSEGAGGSVRIRRLATAHAGWLKIRIATLAARDGVEFTREIEDHGNGVTVLPYDPVRRTALLVRMPRAPVLHGGGTDHLLETPAGLVEPGEDVEDCARREAMEEAGVKLRDLEAVGKLWSMPGVSTERMDLFLAPYRGEDRVATGGGLVEEHENITVVEVPLAELAALADRNALPDMKTLTLVLTLRVRHPDLFG